jgi:mRNA interferase HigB
MRVISNKILVKFGSVHAGADTPLQAWRKAIESREFGNYADLKSVFPSVDKVADYYVFNVGGNKYRVVTIVRFNQKKIFVRDVFTHKEYDAWKP